MAYLKPIINDKADIIIGNPPFGHANNHLWSSISNREIELLKPGGVMVFITPQNFVYHSQPDGNGSSVFYLKGNVMRNHHLINLDIKKRFTGINSSFAAWALHKKRYDNNNELWYDGIMGNVVKKIINKGKETRNVQTDNNNHTTYKKSNHSETQSERYKWRLYNGRKELWTSIQPKFYAERKVIGFRIQQYFFVADTCGVNTDGYFYLKEGLEYELCHAFNSKIIKKFLAYCKVGPNIPHPVIRQMPNFTDEALLSIRKVMEDAGENKEVMTKELSDDVRDKINEIVKSDLELTDEDEQFLYGML